MVTARAPGTVCFCMDIPERAAWTLKALNSLRLRKHRHNDTYYHSRRLRSQVTSGSRLYPFVFHWTIQISRDILFLIKTLDDHSITRSALKCTYFPLSEPTPYSHLPPPTSHYETNRFHHPPNQTNDSPKTDTVQLRVYAVRAVQLRDPTKPILQGQQSTTATIPRKKEKAEPKPPDPQNNNNNNNNNNLTPSASSPPAQSQHQAPSPPPPTA